MARYQIILAYDGTDYLGFQRQADARTVQGVVESALVPLGWSGRAILFAGRTDTGVHGEGQVIAFDLEWGHTCEELGRALNANLPADVAARKVQEAAPSFHPRYDARGRTYQYRICCEAERNPLRERYAWRVWPEPDPDLLSLAAQILVGEHDFAAFGAPVRPNGRTRRRVYQANWQLQGGDQVFEISANAFLYHMVRRMVYLQVLVGQKRLDLEVFTRAISQVQTQTPGLAPAHGLVLKEVWYDERSL